MNATTIEIGTDVYRVGALTPMQQFHVFRRLAPLIASVQNEISDAVSAPSTLADGADETQVKDEFGQRVMHVIARVISTLGDTDVEYIVNTCLAVVSRKQGDRFAPVVAGNRLVFADIDMATMLRLTSTTIQENLGGFFGQGIGAMLSPRS